MKHFHGAAILIGLLSIVAHSGYGGDASDIRRWITHPFDLNGDGAVNYIDLFLLAGDYSQPNTPTPTPTPTPNPAQANLPPVGEIQEVPVADSTIPLALDFPTGAETYLLIVRNENSGGAWAEVGLYDEDHLPTSKTSPQKRIRSTPWASQIPRSKLSRIPEVMTFPTSPVLAGERPRKLLAVGDQKTFDLYGGARVTGILRYLGKYGAIYVDESIWMQGDAPVDQDLVDTQGAFFDTTTYPVITSVFGEPGDVNGDGHIAILFTTAGAGFGEDAFFFSGDLFTRAELDPQFPTNTMEILYISPPNTPGKSIGEEDIPGNIAHEFQHLINFYYHSLIYGGRNGLHNEERWLDEGLSHLAEDYVGSAFASNPDRVTRFLDAMDGANAFTDQQPNSTQRGGEYLFCRYIADRFGDSILKTLVETGKQGIENVEATTGMTFAEIIRDWSRAVFLSELGITDNPKWNYTTFSELNYAPGRWWGKPRFWNVDFSHLSNYVFFGPIYYSSIAPGGFSYIVFRNSERGTKEADLLSLSGPKPAIDVVRLPDRFVYPDYIDVDFFQGLILDAPLLDVFKVGEPVTISGRSVDGQSLDSVKIIWWRSGQSSIGPDQRMYATMDGDRFTATLLFDDPSDEGEWIFTLRPNAASLGYNTIIQVVEP